MLTVATMIHIRSILRCVFLPALLASPLAAKTAEPGEVGGPGLAILCAKALVVSPDPEDTQLVDNALVLVENGKIRSVVPKRGAEIPDGFEVMDVGDRWVMPGIFDIHTHVGGTFDINDAVMLVNPGLSVRTAVIPNNPQMRVGLHAGITTILFIPGSATNIGGLGMLLKTGHEGYEDTVVRDPGSFKLAQWGNPESWGPGIGMSFENWNTRLTMKRGLAYAKRWEAFEKGLAPEPERNISYDAFRNLLDKSLQISVHTQMYQVVLMTITMLRVELGFDVYLDHSTIGGWLTGDLAQKHGVQAIVGPRSVDTVSRGMINWSRNKHEGMRGVAAGYQQRGLELVGFNTDAPVIPLETVQLQAGMGVRYGLDDSKLAAVRGLTVVPAITAGLEDRLGSLRPGLDADLIVITGHPADPRSWIETTFVDGKKMYDIQEDHRLW